MFRLNDRDDSKQKLSPTNSIGKLFSGIHLNKLRYLQSGPPTYFTQ